MASKQAPRRAGDVVIGSSRQRKKPTRDGHGVAHGARHRGLRIPSTRGALECLGALGLLPADRARALREAYDFERGLLRSLRLAQARPPDCLPQTGQVLARLARDAGLPSGGALVRRHREVAEFVRGEYARVVGS